MPATIKFFTDPQGPNIFKTVFQTASLPVRTPAERPATLQPAAVRGVLPFRLQQGLRTQHRTLQQKRETLGLCRTVWPAGELEEGAPVPVGGARASLAEQALKNLERAYTNFFLKRSEFPKFKKKGA